MEKEPDPKGSPSTPYPSTNQEPLSRIYTFTAFETLTFIFLPVSFTLALAYTLFFLSSGKVFEAVSSCFIWPISSYLTGLIPIAIYSILYARLHNRGAMTYGRCLLLSFLVIAGVSSFFIPFGLLPIAVAYSVVGFLHAAPTVLLCHLKLSSPGHKWPKPLPRAVVDHS